MKNTPLKLSYVYQCVGCDSFHLQSVGRTVTKVIFLLGFVLIFSTLTFSVVLEIHFIFLIACLLPIYDTIRITA